MIYEEFFSCSSSEDSENTDVPAECQCHGPPFKKDKNFVILELLHEVVHLINEDNPIRDEAMRITNVTPSSLESKGEGKTRNQEFGVMNKDFYPEISAGPRCPFCRQGLIVGPAPSFASQHFVQPVDSTSPASAIQQVPEPFMYDESFKDCFSFDSCICNNIKDVCPKHGPLKILLNKLQCQIGNEKPKSQVYEQETATKSSECFSLNRPGPNKSARLPVRYPPECVYLNESGLNKILQSPVPYPLECFYLNRPGSNKTVQSHEGAYPSETSSTKPARPPTPGLPECTCSNISDKTKRPKMNKILPEPFDCCVCKNAITTSDDEAKVKEVQPAQESVEDFRVYKPCRDCLIEYDDEEPWPCLPALFSTTKAGGIEKQIKDAEKIVNENEEQEKETRGKPSDKLEDRQEKAPSDKLEENQEKEPDGAISENRELEQIDEIEEDKQQEPSDDEPTKSSSHVNKDISQESQELDSSQNDTIMESQARFEQFSFGESKTKIGNESDNDVVEIDDENELAKERIAESNKIKEQEEEDNDYNKSKQSNPSLASAKQTPSTSKVAARKERDDNNRDGEDNNKNSDMIVATVQRSESEVSTNEMKFFIDSLITDLNAMDYARRRQQFEKDVCKTFGLCARDSFPVTITNVSDLGANSLYVQWKIHDCFGISGYEIYTDGYLTNRYYNSRHDAAVITNVDVTASHKIALVAQSCANDESIDLICNMNRDKNKPKSLQWKTDEEKGRESYSCLWTPSIFLYDPNSCRATVSAH